MPLDLTQKIYDRLSNSALNKLQKSMYRVVDLIENFFPIPDEPGTAGKLVLYPDQRDLIDTIQYGFPLSKFRFSEMEGKIISEGGICMSRRQIGKSVSFGYSSAALNIIGGGFPDYKIPCFCGMIAASEDASIELVEKTKFVLENSDFNDFITGRTKLDRIKLINGSFTRAHPCSIRSVRGKKYHYLFGDEGRWMEEEVLFHAGLPTVEHGFRWFIITTPQGTKGELTKMYINAVQKRPVICKNCLAEYTQKDFPLAKFPDKNRIWEMPPLPPCKHCGNTKYKYGIGYIATPWINPWDCPIIDRDKLKVKMDYYGWSPWARQEWLGELLDEASNVFLSTWIKNSTNLHLRNKMRYMPGLRYVLGLDYGRRVDATVFTIMHKNQEQQIILDYMRVMSGEFDFSNDWDQINEAAREIISFYKPWLVIADSTGIGYREVEKMHRQIKSWSPGSMLYNSQKNFHKLPPEKRRLGFWFDRINKPQLIDNLKMHFSTNPPILQIPPKTEPEMDELVTELLNFDCKVHENTGYIEYGTQDFHDDRVISLALAVWGFNSFIGVPRAKAKTVDYELIKKIPGRNPNYRYKKRKPISRVMIYDSR